MKQLRNLILIVSVISLLFLSSCVTLIQDMSVAEDGSGTIRFAIGVETTAYPQFKEAIPEGYQLENFLATLMQDEVITDVQEDNYQDGGYTWELIEMTVSDFSLLFEEDRRIGPLVISLKQQDDTYIFSQIIDMAGSNLQIPGVNLLDMTGAGFTVRLNSPQIISTTGVQRSGETSEWEIPLGDLLQSGETIFLQAAYSLVPYEGLFIPWEVFYPYVVIGFLALGGFSILVVIFLNTRKKKEDMKKIEF